MADPVAIFGAVTGGGGLILGVLNTIHNFGKETRDRQREIRGELRLALIAATDAMKSVDLELSLGNDVPDVDPAFKALSGKIDHLRGGLQRPPQLNLLSASSDLSTFYYAWRDLARSQENQRQMIEHGENLVAHQQRFNAKITRTKETLVAAKKSTKVLLDELNKIDKGL